MPARTRSAEEGRPVADRIAAHVADELRIARLNRGLTQKLVGLAIGVDLERISAVERRQSHVLTIHQLASHAAVLGLKLSVKFYPVGDSIRDAAQVRYITRFVERVGSAWSVGL